MAVANPAETGYPPHSYERFASRPFYQELDRTLIRQAPRVQRVLDLATGTGAAISHLFQEGKLQAPFVVVGIDTDAKGLSVATQKFEKYANGSNPDGSIHFVNGSAEDLSEIPNGSQDLVTMLNSIHLTDVPTVLSQAAAKLKDGGVFLANSAYEKSNAYPPGTRRFWGLLVGNARKILKEEQGISEFQDPLDLMQHSEDDFRQMAEEAGFSNVEISTYTAVMDQEALEAICDYDGFAEGTLPGVNVDLATDALVRAVEPSLARFGGSLERNWMFLKTVKNGQPKFSPNGHSI